MIHHLPAFEALIPGLVEAYNTSDKNPKLKGAIDILSKWNFKTSKESVAMTLSHFYGTRYYKEGKFPKGMIPMERVKYWGSKSPNSEKLQIFEAVIDKLTDDFGTWEMAWGEVNRYQRLNGDIRQEFDDTKPKYPDRFCQWSMGSISCLWS